MRTLAFTFMLFAFEYLAAAIVENVDARDKWARIASKNGEAVPANSIANRILLRAQRALVFACAALTAILVDEWLALR